MARRLVKVWLDDTDPTDRALLEEIARLKDCRQFTPTFRNAMSLAMALRDGESGELQRQFPDVTAKLLREHHSLELMQLRAELAEVKLQLIATGTPPPPKRTGVQKTRDVKLEVRQAPDDEITDNLLKSLDMFS